MMKTTTDMEAILEELAKENCTYIYLYRYKYLETLIFWNRIKVLETIKKKWNQSLEAEKKHLVSKMLKTNTEKCIHLQIYKPLFYLRS